MKSIMSNYGYSTRALHARKLPQTGDNANPLLYLGIGALALITGVGVGLRGSVLVLLFLLHFH